MPNIAKVTRLSAPSVFGLNDWAEKFVAQARKEASGESARLLEASRPLYKYIFPDGRVYSEKVQPQKISADQFLALQGEQGFWLTESLWKNSEIEEICSFL
ncbi:MAG: hypothetical protein A2750_01390 [Candidatus Yanofskybacteria bacterium RIFCSPHIGHO2_01_FULL_45_42]|uniref:Uncharacterized protein n=2 Tax=Parcubacteria group TaxID=1794811 RepID=A0A1G1ZT14_9BACT|nr:MAG: hypothetical protein A2750_01390 [Candidatus Yanofskybacteria bacterium RIFCSPHIGHO2_01_FULL_45_42]OGY63887.1 MAG: hypothetical protein A3J53_03640 [Candidatus Harrisonbacteria bacterium RIFCSPHIGHO2_02_FULL_40_20]OGY66967.1 MAG: hypothetical protein A3I24_00620 [Candidatus Harrisonbacteria bacterium RIFCSPLOWO2_02_FULL_41_13b]